MNGMDGHHIYPNTGSDLTREDTFSKMSTITSPATAQSWWKSLVQMWKDFIQ
jgi:hypothetical protein